MNRFKNIFFALALMVPFLLPDSANAVTGSDFQPGHIIDDQIFFDGTAMTVGQIQAFLASKVSSCDVNGNQIFTGYYDGRDSAGVNHSPIASPHSYTSSDNIKRANLDNRYPAPYTCVKDYLENPSIANSGVKGTSGNNMGQPGFVPAGCTVDSNGYNTCSAAYIIRNAAQQYNISPKVLIVLLQKESALITDDWPWPNEYKTATGYGCPDTAACDSTYFGFYNQVHSAAHQFRLYATSPNNYNYIVGSNTIKYNPSVSCGTAAVTILTQATAGLYNYTPYLPNQAALNNLYGTGDGCSSYGNRNFWRLFNDWFGSTLSGPTCKTAGQTNVYRFWSQRFNNAHFFTANAVERDTLLSDSNWHYEGVAYCASAAPATSYLPIYRFWSPMYGNVHFFTASEAEKAALLNDTHWQYEGIAFYSPTDPSIDSNAVAIARFWSPKFNNDHFFTGSVAETNALKGDINWRFESTAAWYGELPQ